MVHSISHTVRESEQGADHGLDGTGPSRSPMCEDLVRRPCHCFGRLHNLLEVEPTHRRLVTVGWAFQSTAFPHFLFHLCLLTCPEESNCSLLQLPNQPRGHVFPATTVWISRSLSYNEPLRSGVVISTRKQLV